MSLTGKEVGEYWYSQLRGKIAPVFQQDKLKHFIYGKTGNEKLAKQVADVWFNTIHGKYGDNFQKQKIAAVFDFNALKKDMAPQKENMNIRQLIRTELYNVLKEENQFPNMKEWWKEPKDKLLSFVFWTQRQVPPSDPKKKEESWKKIVAHLQKQYPAPQSEYQKKLQEFDEPFKGQRLSIQPKKLLLISNFAIHVVGGKRYSSTVEDVQDYLKKTLKLDSEVTPNGKLKVLTPDINDALVRKIKTYFQNRGWQHLKVDIIKKG